MIRYGKKHSAFTLLEVIFVLVILGIISSIGSSMIVQVYESYITQNALYKANAKTELVSNQVVNRLSYAIPGTTISKDISNPGIIEDINWIRLEKIPSFDTNFTTIEWIGYDNDSFSAYQEPAWSGLANYQTSTQNRLDSPGSNFPKVAEIMKNLSNKKVDLTLDKPAAVLFRPKNNYYTSGGGEYSPACMGLIDNNTSCIWPVYQGLNVDQLLFKRTDEPKIITERYKLAWSAYALVPVADGKGLYDIFLHYNYQPWNGEQYNDPTTSKKLLMKHVSVFKFTENGGVIQFKLCAQENMGEQFPITTCKEKAILR